MIHSRMQSENVREIRKQERGEGCCYLKLGFRVGLLKAIWTEEGERLNHMGVCGNSVETGRGNSTSKGLSQELRGHVYGLATRPECSG